MEKESCNRNLKLWIWVVVAVVLCIALSTIYYFTGFKCKITGQDVISVVSHLSSLVFCILLLLVLCECFKLIFKEWTRENEYKRKKELECLQKENYEKHKQAGDADGDLEKKIISVMKKFVENQYSDYNEALKRFKSDVKLYDDIRKIIEREECVQSEKSNKS